MTKGVRFLSVLPLAFAAGIVFADQPQQLLCATRSAVQCIAGTECARGLPEAFGLPSFLHLDLENKIISADDLSADIKSLSELEEGVALQGMLPDRTWALVFDSGTGWMTASVTGAGEGFVVFGVCKPVS